MQIKLNKLTIRNFKGIKEYDLSINGNNADVSGENASGKTTLYDAFLWCLFGKDSTDKAQFDWKPLDEQGNEINHLETEVTAEIDIDGRTKTLTRITKEKWTKNRGSAIETFSGHTTIFKVDDLSVKKKEYESQLNELIGEDLFKLLTSVSYFPEVLKWKERRETLIEMVGDITDKDVIAKNKELQPLKVLIEERPASELKQLTEQQMRQINKDLKAIPNRIDEVDRGLPDISKLDKTKLNELKEKEESAIAELQSEIAKLKNSDETVELKNKVKELGIHYREMEMDHDEKLTKELESIISNRDDLEKTKMDLTNEQKNAKQKVENIHWEIEQKKKKLKFYEEDTKALREKFIKVRDEVKENFDAHQTSCPTCGQDLPGEDILVLRSNYEKEVEEFNAHKAQHLQDIQEDGKNAADKASALVSEIKEAIEEIEGHESELSELDTQEKEIDKKLRKLDEEIKGIKDNQKLFEDTELAIDITKQGKELRAEIDGGQSSVKEDVEKLNAKIANHEGEISEINDQLQEIVFHKKQSERRDELIEQEQTLSTEYGELEQQLYLLEEFVRSKVNLLTDTINDRFDIVKFKLFEEQINGGLDETCEATVDGANYSTGLNNAARINAGLDIINTLMNHYDIKVPVFIDNAEGINDLIDIDTQLITLSVSKHKNLRVEVA